MLTAHSSRIHLLLVLGLAVLMGNGWHLTGEAVAQPKEQMVIAVDFSIAPTCHRQHPAAQAVHV